MSQHESSTVTVEATFHDGVVAEIASALLSDASLPADEPQAVGRKWLVRVSGLTPTIAGRAEAILRTAGAIHVQMVVSKAAERRLRCDWKLAM